MASIFSDFHEAQRLGNGLLLAACLAPINIAQSPRRLESFSQLSNVQMIAADIRYDVIQAPNAFKMTKAEGNAWVDIFIAYWKCVKELMALTHEHGGSWSKCFDAYKDVCTRLIRGYTNDGFGSWTVPCLSTTGKYLRMIAMKADQVSKDKEGNGDVFANGFSDDIMGTSNKNDKLETAAWTINRMFTTCLSDRSELAESRKWAIYSTTNLLFKTYFKLNNISLTRNIIRALTAAEADLPPLHLFPRAQRCTFKYYRGVIDFLQEDYPSAETNLSEALSLCHRDALHNREQILTYLIPTHVVSHHKLPTSALLQAHPTLDKMLTPLFKAIKLGHLHAFDEALAAVEEDLIRRRIYLTLERTRDICMRNLFRKVFMNAGWDETRDANTGEVTSKLRKTRVFVAEFEAGMKIAYKGSEEMIMDRDEVECFLTNMIYKNLMKGYIARERGIVVLSKAGAFPGTGV